jgi:hypothetical protein
MAAEKIEEFDQAAFDALDKEAKEFDKVRLRTNECER